MQAAISGLQGIAILIDDTKLNLIDISNPTIVNACSNSFATRFLSGSFDCVFVDNVSVEAVAKQLKASWDGHSIIRLVSIINDSTADAELLADAVEELNEIASVSRPAVEFAERYLLSAPTLIALSRLSAELPEAVKSIFTQLNGVQPAISLVLQAIDDSLQSELQNENERAATLATFIREGVVRKFVLAVSRFEDLDSVLEFANELPAIGQRMRPVLSAIQSSLKAARTTLNIPVLKGVKYRRDSSEESAHQVNETPVQSNRLETIAEISPPTQPEITSFKQLDLSPVMLRCLKKLGYETPSPIQAQVIPAALDSRDIIGQARTGTGKTAAFGIPILELLDPLRETRNPQALILVPTRELAVQVLQEIERLAWGCRTACALLAGGKHMRRQMQQLQDGTQIVVGTPGRVMDHIQRGTFKTDDLWCVVLDEADRMLDIGFGPVIEKILHRCPEDRQTMLLSATMPPGNWRLAKRYLQYPVYIDGRSVNVSVQTIEQYSPRLIGDSANPEELNLLARPLTIATSKNSQRLDENP